MIGTGEALLGLGIIGGVCFWLWLRDRRPREMSLEVAEALRLAREAQDGFDAAAETVRRETTGARAELEKAAAAAGESLTKTAEEVRREMNTLAAAQGLTRRPGPFAGPAAPNVREVIR